MSSISVFEGAKNLLSYVISYCANTIYSDKIVFLPNNPLHQTTEERIVRRQFEELSHPQKNEVYNKIWELAKMQDPQISGDRWGEEHAFDSLPRLSIALDRLGFFRSNNNPPIPVRCLSPAFGEGGIGSQYFSLSERADREPTSGQVGYVNGMGVPTLAHAGRDATRFSDRFTERNNIHCVYHATHQATPSGDLIGFGRDLLRMQAVEGGSYTKTSYLIAQQWLDFLDSNPTRNYLQIAHSEGTVHLNAALRLIHSSRPDLLKRVRVVTFCPAHFILPENYGQGLQVINLFKIEDTTINPWAKGISQVGTSPHIITVAHHGDHPHNHLSDDYVGAGKCYIDEFMRSGNIY
jgi:hypothetical protein